MADDREFQNRVRTIEGLIQTLEDTAEPTTRAQARELVQAILEHHGVGLAKIMELANQCGNPRLLEALVRDDLVGSLLLLHGLHPVDAETRVRRAIENMQPRLFVHGSRVQLVAVEDNAVRLHLQVGENGSPADAAPHQLKRWIEEAVCGAAPEVAAIVFEETETAAPGLISLPIVAGEFVRGRS